MPIHIHDRAAIAHRRRDKYASWRPRRARPGTSLPFIEHANAHANRIVRAARATVSGSVGV
ncbi:hypothetical protein DAH76_06230 [Sphingomonas koreensis]|nr:hypothetical protein BRX39_21585 [Sphingomonas koreensis]RSU29288.1 hypothetical protein CA225_07620 [Sphingomonas koreensis]RSU48823.1 hypothetical protein CA221_15330 [Sphingomonas koreensis]RSU89068.1 hypothetical protein CA253_08885 [Sphingomonas koreensis]RSX13560.1 hypothetical protein CA227_08695 [Sphingomonas koreensis]